MPSKLGHCLFIHKLFIYFMMIVSETVLVSFCLCVARVCVFVHGFSIDTERTIAAAGLKL